MSLVNYVPYEMRILVSNAEDNTVRILREQVNGGPSTPYTGMPVAVIVAGEIPFFADSQSLNERAKAEIGRFIARNCEGRCSSDPVEVPVSALEEMALWDGRDTELLRVGLWGRPDWARALQRWIYSKIWAEEGSRISPREERALRKTLQILSGAPFPVGTKVVSTGGLWGFVPGTWTSRDAIRQGTVIATPSRGPSPSAMGTYEVRLPNNEIVFPPETEMQRTD